VFFDSTADQAKRRLYLTAAVALTTAALLTTMLVTGSADRDTAEGPAGPEHPAPARTAAVPATSGHTDEPSSSSASLRSGPLARSQPISLRIESIGLATGPLADLGLTGGSTRETPRAPRTAGWLSSSPTPGELGPAIIAGHVSYESRPGVFAQLSQVRTGDAVTVRRADGRDAVFSVYRVDRYTRSALPAEKLYGRTRFPELRLITCGGAYDRASAQTQDNVIVFARLIGVR
jgi:hypothetical protein